MSKIFIGICMLSLASVAFLSLFDPQAAVDLVQTPLPNNDALSSIRGVYGGVRRWFYLWNCSLTVIV